MKSNIPIFALFALFIFSACQSSPKLEEGYWTGTLTPMNHPENGPDLQWSRQLEIDSECRLPEKT